MTTLHDHAVRLVAVLYEMVTAFRNYRSPSGDDYFLRAAESLEPLVDRLKYIVESHESRDHAVDFMADIKLIVSHAGLVASHRDPGESPSGTFWKEYAELSMIFQEARFSAETL